MRCKIKLIYTTLLFTALHSRSGYATTYNIDIKDEEGKETSIIITINKGEAFSPDQCYKYYSQQSDPGDHAPSELREYPDYGEVGYMGPEGYGYVPEGFAPIGYEPVGNLPEEQEGQPAGYSPEGYPPEGDTPEYYGQEGYPPEDHPPEDEGA